MSELFVAEHRVCVHEAGEGDAPPLVCVHSTGLSGRQWRRLMRKLGKERRCFAPDLIGYGETDTWKGPGPFRTEVDLAVLDAVLDLVGGPVHLVGHSYGGRVALHAARQRPHLVCSIACFEPVVFGVLHSADDRPGIEELAAYDGDGVFLDDGFGGTDAWLERFVDYWSGDGTWRDMEPEERARFSRSSRKMFEEVRETCLDRTPHTAFTEIEAPTLLLSGSESTLAGRRCCAVLAQHMRDANHIEVPTGHMGPLLAPAEVSAPIIEHIRRVDAALANGGRGTAS